jgi:hypothetical protein
MASRFNGPLALISRSGLSPCPTSRPVTTTHQPPTAWSPAWARPSAGQRWARHFVGVIGSGLRHVEGERPRRAPGSPSKGGTATFVGSMVALVETRAVPCAGRQTAHAISHGSRATLGWLTSASPLIGLNACCVCALEVHAVSAQRRGLPFCLIESVSKHVIAAVCVCGVGSTQRGRAMDSTRRR